MIVDIHTHVWEPPHIGEKFAEDARITSGNPNFRIAVDLNEHWAAMAPVDRVVVLGFRASHVGVVVPNEYVMSYVKGTACWTGCFFGTDYPFRQPLRLNADGSLPVPTGPGLGVEVKEEALERYRVQYVAVGRVDWQGPDNGSGDQLVQSDRQIHNSGAAEIKLLEGVLGDLAPLGVKVTGRVDVRAGVFAGCQIVRIAVVALLQRKQPLNSRSGQVLIERRALGQRVGEVEKLHVPSAFYVRILRPASQRPVTRGRWRSL